jgi:poly-gamma-glutamate capsule biosynthesis protein CapA/YwtB (metallophosphatase superfamily)
MDANAREDIAIGLLGDVMLGRGVGSELKLTLQPEQLWAPELRALAGSLDAVICNLECAISARGTPTTLIPGKPFFFRGPPVALGTLQAIGVRVVTLANNHALDFGPLALADTVTALSEAGIGVAGAGPDRETARRAAVIEVAGRRVAVVAATDHPAEYAAKPSNWGVAYAPLRHGPPQWLLDEIAAARRRCDLVIAFPHWGPNMAVRPAAWQRRTAVTLQDAGVDLIAGHSAHLFHGIQSTPAGPILYDLGDAIDDYRVDPWLRNDLGILAIWHPAGGSVELVGLRLEYAHTGLARGADADWIAARLQQACSELGTSVRRIAEQHFRIEAEDDRDSRAANPERHGPLASA